SSRRRDATNTSNAPSPERAQTRLEGAIGMCRLAINNCARQATTVPGRPRGGLRRRQGRSVAPLQHLFGICVDLRPLQRPREIDVNRLRLRIEVIDFPSPFPVTV